MIVLGVDVAGSARKPVFTLTAAFPAGDRLRLLSDRLLKRNPTVIGLDALMACCRDWSARRSLVVGIDALHGRGTADLPHPLAAAGVSASVLALPAGIDPGKVQPHAAALAIAVAALSPRIRVCSVHPAAALLERKADRSQVRTLKRSASARTGILAWLAERGVAMAPAYAAADAGVLLSLVSAWSAWQWSEGRAARTADSTPYGCVA